MKRNHLIVAVAAMGALGACNNAGNDKNTANYKDVNNPFFKESPLQYQAPEFDKIKLENYKPAFDSGMAQQNAEIKAIVDNKEEPSFQNTILPLETSGTILRRATSVFYNLTSTISNDDIKKLEEEYSPIFSAHSDGIYLNDALFQKVKKVYENRDAIQDPEDKKLVSYYFEKFEMAGANLDAEAKEKLKKLNETEASLVTKFSAKLLNADKNAAVVFDTKEELDGLSADELAAAQTNAKEAGKDGKYLIKLLNTTQQPVLSSLNNRASREKIFKASTTRAELGNDDDTRSTIEELAKVRLQKAKLMGKPNFAAWKLQDQMAKTPEAAYALLKQVATPAVAAAKKEAAALQEMINAGEEKFELAPWDWSYYAEKLRKAKYDLDEAEIKPYFEINTVLEKGVFYMAEHLYGITFKKRDDLPKYHPDVQVYEVFDRDGKSIAIYYLDFYKREGKRGGAWMSNFVEQSHVLKQKPVLTNVYNYPKPADGRPSLISFDDVETMFHEFGHTIHGLFADQKYTSLSGTNVPRDYVEFPSQTTEHWALDTAVLKNYAIHYETKQVIPDALVEKLKKAATFNAGFGVTEIVAAASLDLVWHSITDEKQVTDVKTFEQKALNDMGLYMPQVPPRYSTPYFAHIWGGGYSASYYAYVWSEVLDQDAFAWFKENGGLKRENGDRFREYILSIGNTKDLNQAYKDFAGRSADIKPLLRSKGFIQ